MSAATGHQSTIFFGTPVNFPSLTKVGVARFRLGGEDAAYMVAAWYTHMRSIAKQSSTFGEFSTTSPLFVRSLGAAVPAPTDPLFDVWMAHTARTWMVFDDVDLIDLHGDPMDAATEFRVVVLDFDETNVSRPTRRDTKRRVAMTGAERNRVSRENAKRVAAGLPKMSHQERDSWLEEMRSDTKRHAERHATRHDTGKGEETKGLRAVSLDRADRDTAEIIRQRTDLEQSERMQPAADRLGAPRTTDDIAQYAGAARTEAAVVPAASAGEPLHIDGSGAVSGGAIAATPAGSTPAEALPANAARTLPATAPQSAHDDSRPTPRIPAQLHSGAA